ncbi:MAG TPA: trigger factor [Polyangiaceae bacterium]|nr:trigger factor [Polyangiaceae bacterium]
MQVNVQQLSPVLVEFQVEVPADRVKTEVDKAYQTLQKTARVKGFRPGKAPREVLTHLFGDRITVDVTRSLVDATLPQALTEKNVQPLSQPNIESQKLATGTNFSYKARFEVRPEIASVKYDGFEVTRPSITVTDAMLDEELENLRKAHAVVSPPAEARASKKGDILEISFTVDVAGKRVPEAAGDDVQVELGAGQFLPELDLGLTGVAAGTEKDISVQFAANHVRLDFRSKPAVFHVKLKEVKERVLPALDDDFAKDVGTFQTLAELKEDAKKKIEKALKQKAEDTVAEQLVAKLVEANPIPCPPSLVEQQCSMMEQEIAQQARRNGEPVPRHEELHARVHADSEVKVRAGLLMAEIAKEVQIKVTDEDIEKGLAELADQMGKQVAKLRVEYRDQKRREMLIGMIIEDKILDIIESKAKITET